MLHRLIVMITAMFLVCVPAARAETGYDLWLRYERLPDESASRLSASAASVVVLGQKSDMTSVASAEIQRGIRGLTGTEPTITDRVSNGAIVLARLDQLPVTLRSSLASGPAGTKEGFRVASAKLADTSVTLIAASTDRGLLYGAFALLRELSVGQRQIEQVKIEETPAVTLRLLNHWDNPDGHVERGYSGRSIFDWWRLPGVVDRRLIDYARANASLGINGAVLNNVNARADMLTPSFIAKTAAIADVLRPYGIRVYLSARFSAPRDIGGLPNADPLNPAVRDWWKSKADEIYAAIPDFGGFLVKANSEGQPGPQDYGRTHVDGANMLAEAVGNRGIIMWRAFVYAAERDEDRVRQAYSEFKPFDGQFASNVMVQVKNGPLDFQPREPFHPLFGGMPKTPLMMEFQITKEYLGFATHLAYLAPMWREVLDADTFVKGKGATVRRVIDGSLDGHTLTGIAGVANIGSDLNWSGSHFDQANWYAFGRLAWNPDLPSKVIGDEWTAQTFTRRPDARATIVKMMEDSREAVVDYMTPLGLTHLMGTGHHYGPAPWVDNLERADWNPFYFHRAAPDGIGVDRTAKGTNALAQYARPLEAKWGNRKTVGDDYLLWFHRVGWDEQMNSGRTLWQELIYRYDRGVAKVGTLQTLWKGLSNEIDAGRHLDVTRMLAVQREEAQWWRDASIAYWMDRSGRSLPQGAVLPPKSLEHYKSLSFPYAPGN